MFISDPNSDIPKYKYNDIIFAVIIASEIYKRFDCSGEFWHIFGQEKSKKEKN